MTYRFPSLNGLKTFEAAARHLSFKAAAAELGVTAGAVSQQVKRLETSLGISLFRRLPQGLLLTREGAAYLPGGFAGVQCSDRRDRSGCPGPQRSQVEHRRRSPCR